MNLFKSLKISWLSPEAVKKISFGEITNHGMLDTKTLKPKPGGLFDPKIFGNFIGWECYCGKYKGKKNVGQKCERCEVTIADKNIQRWRMGHISFSVPVTNIMFFKSLSGILSKLLKISASDLENIIYLNSYVVINRGESNFIKEKEIFLKGIKAELVKNLLAEIISRFEEKEDNEVDEKNKIKVKAQQLLKRVNKIINDGSIFFWEDFLPFLEKNFQIKIYTGSEAFLHLLKTIDLEKELNSLQNNLRQKSSQKNVIKFCQHLLLNNEIKLEWMVMQNLLVLPAGLRPVNKLKKEETMSGKEILATTQINTLYRKVVLANENVDFYNNAEEKDFFGEVIVNNAKRRLQKAVDQLFLGSLKKVNDAKGLMPQLSGKDGILRHYSLGKRTDFSARAVISSSADIKLDEIKIPVQIAAITFRPLIIRNLLQKKIVFTIKEAEEIINRELFNQSGVFEQDKVVFRELNQICSDYLVLFNRAPSLHRLSMQAARPKLTLGKTIDIHPLVTTPYNADFDGDMLLILNLLTKEELYEAEEYMLTTTQVLDPKNGNVITIPKQDIVLGLYYLTKEKKPEKIIFFDQLSSIWKEYDSQRLGLHDLFVIPTSLIKNRQIGVLENCFFITTLGKIIFNQIFPESFPFFINNLERYNRVEDEYDEPVFLLENIEQAWNNRSLEKGWTKPDLVSLVNKIVKQHNTKESTVFLDNLKDLGFFYVNLSGISISPFEIGEVISDAEKKSIIDKWLKKSQTIDDCFSQGLYSRYEWKEDRQKIWQSCKEEVKDLVLSNFKKQKDSSLYYIWESGARISSENLAQLFAMRGYVSDYRGQIIETPIISSLWEGLNPFETFVLTYGMVKGLIDKALRTAESGYLTRRLVEASQEVIVNMEDCWTKNGLKIEEENFEIFSGRVFGRFLSEDLLLDKEVILPKNTLLEREEIKILKKNNISSVFVFSSLFCEAENGVCQKCYGSDLSKRYSPVGIGTAVGIIAAQSLGEPGTQLTLRTFHTGGVASSDEDIVQQGLPRLQHVLDNLKPKIKSVLAKDNGIISKIDDNFIYQKTEEKEIIYSFDKRAKKPLVAVGWKVNKGDKLTTGVIDLEEYLNLVGRFQCQQYIVKEVKEVYADQGIEIHEKHIEIFATCLLSRVQIIEIKHKNKENFLLGDLVSYKKINLVNKGLDVEERVKFRSVISSLKDLASSSSSFLASAAFQSPLKCLINYSIYQPYDYLQNPKARIMVGQLAPVGEGFLEIEKYKKIFVDRKKQR